MSRTDSKSLYYKASLFVVTVCNSRLMILFKLPTHCEDLMVQLEMLPHAVNHNHRQIQGHSLVKSQNFLELSAPRKHSSGHIKVNI